MSSELPSEGVLLSRLERLKAEHRALAKQCEMLSVSYEAAKTQRASVYEQIQTARTTLAIVRGTGSALALPSNPDDVKGTT